MYIPVCLLRKMDGGEKRRDYFSAICDRGFWPDRPRAGRALAGTRLLFTCFACDDLLLSILPHRQARFHFISIGQRIVISNVDEAK